MHELAFLKLFCTTFAWGARVRTLVRIQVITWVSIFIVNRIDILDPTFTDPDPDLKKESEIMDPDFWDQPSSSLLLLLLLLVRGQMQNWRANYPAFEQILLVCTSYLCFYLLRSEQVKV